MITEKVTATDTPPNFSNPLHAFLAVVLVILFAVILSLRYRMVRGTLFEDLYARLGELAKYVKTGLQMLIGLATIGVITWHVFYYMDWYPHLASALLGDVAIALAAAAVVELAYTLFTPGPDEALNPLMLGISSGMLLQINALEEPSIEGSVSLLILGVLLGGLFLIRLLLVHDHESTAPQVWWGRYAERMLSRKSDLPQLPSTPPTLRAGPQTNRANRPWKRSREWLGLPPRAKKLPKPPVPGGDNRSGEARPDDQTPPAS